jgi:hypothetical protein
MTSFGFKLAPDFFDKRVDGKGSSQEITFWNDSTETVRYRVYVESSEEKNFDMAKWVEIYPQIITLKPKSTGKVRLFAKAPQEQPIGEYQFYFGIRTLSLPKTNSESQESQISLPINLKIKMYGYNGEIPQDVALKNYHFVKEGDEIKFKGNFINDTKNISIKSKIILSGKGMTESFRTGRIKEGTFDFDIPLQKFKNPNNIEEILILDEMTNKRIQRIKLK